MNSITSSLPSFFAKKASSLKKKRKNGKLRFDIISFTAFAAVMLPVYIILFSDNNSQTILIKEDNTTKYKSKIYNKGLSHSMDAIDIRPIDNIPISPLDTIPEFDKLSNLKQKASWNPLDKLYSPEFHELDLEQRCAYYFRQLYLMNPNWNNDYHKAKFDIKDYYIKDEAKDKNDITADEDLIRLHRRRFDGRSQLERIRIYDRCFIQNDIDINSIFDSTDPNEIINPNNKNEPKNAKNVKKEKKKNKNSDDTDSDKKMDNFNHWDFEHRMFPFLKLFNDKDIQKDFVPRIRYGNDLLPKGKIPILSDDTRLKARYTDFVYDTTKPFWVNWNRMASSVARRGVVLQVTDNDIEPALKLISVLRYQNNTLPIQIVNCFDQISDENIEKLVYAAQSEKYSVPLKDGSERPGYATPQEIMFLDLREILNFSFQGDFTGSRSRWLGAIFSLFEEQVAIKIDTIPYVGLNYFFSTKEYLETGTHFFRDRIMIHKLNNECSIMFGHIHPSIPEKKYFDNIPHIDREYIENECDAFLDYTEQSYRRFFVDYYKHQMHEGLLSYDKSVHIMALISGAVLNNMKFKDCLADDSEFYWLGFVASGHSFAFDPVNAGAIGDMEKRENEDDQIYIEVCSIQLAHFTADNHMLWASNGALNCKEPNAAQADWDNPKIGKGSYPLNKFDSAEDAQKKFYDAPVDLTYAVIGTNDQDAWGKKTLACKSLNWCTRYEKKFREFSYDDYTVQGTFIKFKGNELVYLQSVNDIWIQVDPKKVGKTKLTG